MTDDAGIPAWWKPYSNDAEYKRDRATGDLVLADEIKREMAQAGWTHTDIPGPPKYNEPCETCGSPVHFCEELIGGHVGWWMWIGYHHMGDAYIPHDAASCQKMKKEKLARGSEVGPSDIL